jgi:hypothetical protein
MRFEIPHPDNGPFGVAVRVTGPASADDFMHGHVRLAEELHARGATTVLVDESRVDASGFTSDDARAVAEDAARVFGASWLASVSPG